MIDTKLERAARIVARIRELDAEKGVTVPGGLNGRGLARMIVEQPHWSARMTKGQRITFAPVYETPGPRGQTVFGERRIEDPDWAMLEVEVKGELVLIVNVRKSDISVHRYKPGSWESFFAVDNGGDYITYDRVSFPRPGSQELQALLESEDAGLPPERTGPAVGEDHHEALLRHRSRRKRWRVIS